MTANKQSNLKPNQQNQNSGCEHLLPLSPSLAIALHLSFGKLPSHILYCACGDLRNNAFPPPPNQDEFMTHIKQSLE